MSRYGPPPLASTPRLDALRVAAFRALLARGAPVRPEAVAEAVGDDLDTVTGGLQDLADGGRVRLDDSGAVIGSLGLTLVRTRHRIGLGVDGWIDSTNQVTGDRFHFEVTAGRARAPDPPPVLFLATQAAVSSVIDQWCPLVNFFADEPAASAWAAGAGVDGRCYDFAAACALATDLWRPLLTSTNSGGG